MNAPILPQPLPPRLSPPLAAEYLAVAHGVPLATKTLAKFRSQGGGPRFAKFGARRVLYAVSDLDAWAAEKLGATFGNTAEADNAA